MTESKKRDAVAMGILRGACGHVEAGIRRYVEVGLGTELQQADTVAEARQRMEEWLLRAVDLLGHLDKVHDTTRKGYHAARTGKGWPPDA